MLLRVRTCSVCKHLCDRRWEELARVEKVRRVEMSWERGEVTWAEVRRGGKSWRGGRRWEELRRVEKSWEELRRGGPTWESSRRVEKSREEVKIVELRWRRWSNFESWVAKIEKSWDGLRRGEKSEKWWSQLKSGEAKWRRIHRTELRSCEGPLHLL